MLKFNILTVVLFIMPVAASAQVASATPEAFAQCAAMAEASAVQHRTVIKDPQSADAMQAVADGYRAAATLSVTGRPAAEAKAYVAGMIQSNIPDYLSRLKTADDSVAQIFPSDAEACARIEPQASQLIQKFNAGRVK